MPGWVWLPPPSPLPETRLDQALVSPTPTGASPHGPGLQRSIFRLLCFLDVSAKLDPFPRGILAPALKITTTTHPPPPTFLYLQTLIEVNKSFVMKPLCRTAVSILAFLFCTDMFTFKGKSTIFFFLSPASFFNPQAALKDQYVFFFFLKI